MPDKQEGAALEQAPKQPESAPEQAQDAAQQAESGINKAFVAEQAQAYTTDARQSYAPMLDAPNADTQTQLAALRGAIGKISAGTAKGSEVSEDGIKAFSKARTALERKIKSLEAKGESTGDMKSQSALLLEKGRSLRALRKKLQAELDRLESTLWEKKIKGDASAPEQVEVSVPAPEEENLAEEPAEVPEEELPEITDADMFHDDEEVADVEASPAIPENKEAAPSAAPEVKDEDLEELPADTFIETDEDVQEDFFARGREATNEANEATPHKASEKSKKPWHKRIGTWLGLAAAGGGAAGVASNSVELKPSIADVSAEKKAQPEIVTNTAEPKEQAMLDGGMSEANPDYGMSMVEDYDYKALDEEEKEKVQKRAKKRVEKEESGDVAEEQDEYDAKSKELFMLRMLLADQLKDEDAGKIVTKGKIDELKGKISKLQRELADIEDSTPLFTRVEVSVEEQEAKEKAAMDKAKARFVKEYDEAQADAPEDESDKEQAARKKEYMTKKYTLMNKQNDEVIKGTQVAIAEGGSHHDEYEQKRLASMEVSKQIDAVNEELAKLDKDSEEYKTLWAKKVELHKQHTASHKAWVGVEKAARRSVADSFKETHGSQWDDLNQEYSDVADLPAPKDYEVVGKAGNATIVKKKRGSRKDATTRIKVKKGGETVRQVKNASGEWVDA